jgi:hypothetical protein
MMQKLRRLPLSLLGILCLYLFGYAYARIFVFHTVEDYPEGKGGPRQDYIAKKDRPAGEGWEYSLFLPAIKIEEGIVNYFHDRSRTRTP